MDTTFTPHAYDNRARLFLCWAIGMMVLLALLAFGLMPVVVAFLPPPDELHINVVVTLTSAALAMEVVAFAANLFVFSRAHLTFASSFWIFVGAAVLLVGLSLATVGVGVIAAFLATIAFVFPLKAHLSGLVGIILILGVHGLVGFLVATGFGRILFNTQEGMGLVDEASAALWRTAHRWGFLPYVLLAFWVDGFSKSPTALSVFACVTAIPHVALTAIAASRSGTMYPNQSYTRLPLFVVATWIFVAVVWMPHYGKAENSLLWPLKVAGVPVNSPVWDLGRVPDRDGLVTFRQREYQFRARPDQIAMVLFKPDGQTVVELSMDRREFGASPPTGMPRLSCIKDECVDICASGVPCHDLNTGWYRVTILPAAHSWGTDPRPLNRGPHSGTGHRCAEAGRSGLELCWDPNRLAPNQTLSEIREVYYPALQGAAAYTWISRALDSSGRPAFVANCAANQCARNIEWGGARLQFEFHVSELDDWQRFDAGLFDFAKVLINTRSN